MSPPYERLQPRRGCGRAVGRGYKNERTYDYRSAATPGKGVETVCAVARHDTSRTFRNPHPVPPQGGPAAIAARQSRHPHPRWGG